jgi:transposase-like protein
MTTEEIETKFPGELDAIMYFEHLRWGDKVKCAYCNTEKVSKRQNDQRFHCSQCRRTFSVTTGTNLHSSKLPLKIWMQAFSMGTAGERVIPIKVLQSGLKVSYTTAWRIRHGLKDILENDTNNTRGITETPFEYICRKAVTTKPVLHQAAV